jgi:S1 RNA binding domain protein
VDPEQVKKDFGVSKAAFKKAIGKLLKEKKIKITRTAIFKIYQD